MTQFVAWVVNDRRYVFLAEDVRGISVLKDTSTPLPVSVFIAGHNAAFPLTNVQGDQMLEWWMHSYRLEDQADISYGFPHVIEFWPDGRVFCHFKDNRLSPIELSGIDKGPAEG